MATNRSDSVSPCARLSTRTAPLPPTCSRLCAVNVAQLSKFLPNSTKEQEAYKAQRMQTTMLYGGMDAVASAAGRNGPPTDPIAAALAAHGL